ncbi:hypothetical protein ACFL0I_01335 [Gemmatimonadota bacterium]
MGTEVGAQFSDPRAVAQYIGEAVGTHYNAALRAANAYAKYLAQERDSCAPEDLAEEGLGNFWLEMMRLEQVRQSTTAVISGLRTTPSHYFSDFLDRAEDVFVKRYKDVPEAQRKKLGHTEHQKCLQILRDHKAAGLETHFEVENLVTKWMQMIRIMGGYRE